MRQRVEALLAAHEQPDSVMATRPDEVRSTIEVDLADDSADAAVGLIIGHYKLLEKLGEGGCGVVYVAEQTEPVKRRVALKVIKLGMEPPPEATLLGDKLPPGSTENIRVCYFGDYELVEEIVRGGMGVVYKARPVSLNRIVALKMILAGDFSSAAMVDRFQTEAEAGREIRNKSGVPITSQFILCSKDWMQAVLPTAPRRKET